MRLLVYYSKLNSTYYIYLNDESLISLPTRVYIEKFHKYILKLVRCTQQVNTIPDLEEQIGLINDMIEVLYYNSKNY